MIPTKKKPKIKAIIVNVAAAFLALGFLKNGTALLIASTPVKEEEPEENARKIKAIETPGTTAPGNAVACNGTAPVTILYNPTTISNEITRINVYTGNNRNDADSLRPRRFSIISSKTIVTEIAT